MELTVTSSIQSAPHQTTNVTKQPNRFSRWWMRHYRHIGLASMAGSAVLVCIIAVILLPIIIRHSFGENEQCDPVTDPSTQSTTGSTGSSTLASTVTDSYTSSTTTQTVSIDPLCGANATWNSQAVTVAGSTFGITSDDRSALGSPSDLLVDTGGNLFITDTDNSRVVYWPVNATEGRIVAGTGAFSSWINSFKNPSGLIAWKDQLYVSDPKNYRILAFSLSTTEGSPDGTTIVGRYGSGSAFNQISYVYYMAIDRIRQLFYLSDNQNARILKLNLTDDSLQLVAGTGSVGSTNLTLSVPLGMTVDETTGSLYVADSGNHRIQKFELNSLQGMTIAGGNGFGNDLSQLFLPSGVAIDSNGNVYIADSGNNRIVQWLVGAQQGRIIAGQSSPGPSNMQLNSPVQLKFDVHSNLYVVDQNNHRIQRFDLLSNGC